MTDDHGKKPPLSALMALDGETDVLLDALSDARRRFVLIRLLEDLRPLPLRDVAYDLATWERDTAITEIPGAEIDSIYTSLYHNHVPKLADADLVRYERERKRVAPTERVEALSDRDLLVADG